MEDLLIRWKQFGYALRRRGLGRIIYMLRRIETITNRLKLPRETRLSYDLSECLAIAKQQPLELMH